MVDKIKNWLLEKLKSSNIELFRKIANGLERDKDIPLRFLIQKGFIFFYSTVTAPFNLRNCDKVGSRPRTRHRPHIENMGTMVIGNDVNINSRNVQTDLVTGPHGYLEIGDKTSINFGVSIVANKRVSIGKRVRIGPYTMIYDSNMHVHGDRYKRAPGEDVTIGDDVWLASRVMIMKGSRIGKGTIVAAGSVVSGIVPPYVIVAGVPARIVRYIQPPEESGFMWESAGSGKIVREQVLKDIQKVASGSFGIDVNALTKDQSHNTIQEWDSFRHVNFIRALENEFNIKFAEKDWCRLTSIGKAAKIVEGYLDEKYGVKKKTD